MRVEKIRSTKVATKGAKVERDKEFKLKRSSDRKGKTFTLWNSE
jgi:hypothetical protein